MHSHPYRSRALTIEDQRLLARLLQLKTPRTSEQIIKPLFRIGYVTTAGLCMRLHKLCSDGHVSATRFDERYLLDDRQRRRASIALMPMNTDIDKVIRGLVLVNRSVQPRELGLLAFGYYPMLRVASCLDYLVNHGIVEPVGEHYYLADVAHEVFAYLASVEFPDCPQEFAEPDVAGDGGSIQLRRGRVVELD